MRGHTTVSNAATSVTLKLLCIEHFKEWVLFCYHQLPSSCYIRQFCNKIIRFRMTTHIILKNHHLLWNRYISPWCTTQLSLPSLPCRSNHSQLLYSVSVQPNHATELLWILPTFSLSIVNDYAVSWFRGKESGSFWTRWSPLHCERENHCRPWSTRLRIGDQPTHPSLQYYNMQSICWRARQKVMTDGSSRVSWRRVTYDDASIVWST